MEAFAGQTVPIYWGNPDIASEFNPKAFINCHDFPSLEEALEEVKRIDNDDSLFLEMLKAPAIADDSSAKRYLESDYVSDYLYKILSQEAGSAYRRNRIYVGKRYEEKAAFYQKIDRVLYYPRRGLYWLQNRLKYRR